MHHMATIPQGWLGNKKNARYETGMYLKLEMKRRYRGFNRMCSIR